METEVQILIFNVPKNEEPVLNQEPGVQLEEEPIPEGAFGEPITFTMAATVVAVVAVAGYLYRKSQGESFEEDIEIKKPDGTVEKKRVRWRKRSNDAPKTEVIKEIVALIKQLMGIC